MLEQHFEKSLKRDKIYKLSLWIIGEDSCLILTHFSECQSRDMTPMIQNIHFYFLQDHSGITIFIHCIDEW